MKGQHKAGIFFFISFFPGHVVHAYKLPSNDLILVFLLFYFILLYIDLNKFYLLECLCTKCAFHFSPTVTLCLYLVSSYRVGLDVSIALEFRTSRTSGVLLAVSNQGNDGLGLEIVDGKVRNTHVWLSRTKYSVYSKYRIRPSLWLEKKQQGLHWIFFTFADWMQVVVVTSWLSRGWTYNALNLWVVISDRFISSKSLLLSDL